MNQQHPLSSASADAPNQHQSSHQPQQYLSSSLYPSPGIVEPPPTYACNSHRPSLAEPAGSSATSSHSSIGANSNVPNEQPDSRKSMGTDPPPSSTALPPSAPPPPPPFYHAQLTHPTVLPPGAVPYCTPSSGIGFSPAACPGYPSPPPNVPPQMMMGSSPGAHPLNNGADQPPPVQVVKMIIAVPLGPQEVQLECANCRQSVRTRVVRRAGLLTWLICGALALVGCWPCCMVPFCAQSCQDVEHYCSNCNAFIGKYSRI